MFYDDFMVAREHSLLPFPTADLFRDDLSDREGLERLISVTQTTDRSVSLWKQRFQYYVGIYTIATTDGSVGDKILSSELPHPVKYGSRRIVVRGLPCRYYLRTIDNVIEQNNRNRHYMLRRKGLNNET